MDELTIQDAQLYRTCVGILQYVAGDRVDLQFTTKELARALVKPTVKAMLLLKRCARYIKEAGDINILMEYQSLPEHVDVYCDGDWAGEDTAKST